MKNATEYAKRVKRLLQKLKREGPAPHPPASHDLTDQYLEAVLANFASESRAHRAVGQLRSAVVDINELRVTPQSELAEILGEDFPSRYVAAEEVSRSLNAVYNRTHHVDVAFLAKWAKKRAESFISGLEGLSPFAKACFILRGLGGHAFPVDQQMLGFLQRRQCIPADATVEQAQKFLAGVVKASEVAAAYSLLKRHAATHAPRKSADARPAAAATPASPAETDGRQAASSGSPAARPIAAEPARRPAAPAARRPAVRKATGKAATPQTAARRAGNPRLRAGRRA